VLEELGWTVVTAWNKESFGLQGLLGRVPVSYTNDKGKLVKKKLKVFDFKNPTENHFLAVRQLEVVGELYNRRPGAKSSKRESGRPGNLGHIRPFKGG
jgi:RNase P/RNase MRP subunit p29